MTPLRAHLPRGARRVSTGLPRRARRRGAGHDARRDRGAPAARRPRGRLRRRRRLPPAGARKRHAAPRRPPGWSRVGRVRARRPDRGGRGARRDARGSPGDEPAGEPRSEPAHPRPRDQPLVRGLRSHVDRDARRARHVRTASRARVRARGRRSPGVGSRVPPRDGVPGSPRRLRSYAWTNVSTLPREPWHWLVPSLVLAACVAVSGPRRMPGIGLRIARLVVSLVLVAGLALAMDHLYGAAAALGIVLLPLLAAAVALSPARPAPCARVRPAPRDRRSRSRGRTSTPTRRRRPRAAPDRPGRHPARHRRVRRCRRRLGAPAARRHAAPELDSIAESTRGFGGDGDGVDAAASRRGGGGRVRRRRVQRQQHGADPGDHGGRARDLLAGDHPGVARRPLLHERPLPLPPDAGGGGALSGDPGRAPPGPRQLARRRASRRSTRASRA